MLMNEVRGEVLLRKLPQPVLASLSPEQIAAIRRAAGEGPHRRHPIDARLSFKLPLLGGVYAVLLVGKEKRSPSRRALERQFWPADRLGSLVLVVLGTTVFLLAALIGILFENAILSN